ncbi:MAG TPA: VWA domain-containing protein [Candidatus Aquilonibacter sp.]|nr:VWA domain-containing protein [Candidatus Aquilonibacter sp.]
MRRAAKIRILPFLSLAVAALIATALCVRAQTADPAQMPAPVTPTINLPPPPQGDAQGEKGSTIKSTVEMVVLHVTVTDDRGQPVEGLAGADFRVFEDKVEQKVSLFSHEDIPVTMGLVIDNSGSMREKRAQVNAAAMTFVKTSNPQDEAFVVNFNDEYYLDTDGDFTNDRQNMADALARIDSRGSTALYDAVIGSLNHIKKGHKDRRVLLLVTDGDDTASRSSFSDTIRAAEKSNATIYAIGVFSDDDRKNDKRMVRNSTRVLKELADATGGEAYFPENLTDVTPICEQVAREIRDQYTLGYYPTDTASDGTFRAVKVDVAASGHGKITARTRTGYYAQSTPAAGN